LRQAWANIFARPISKIAITKNGWWRGSKCRP
jgi:hypothetical protein